MTYIINSSAIILFINGKSERVEKTSSLYPRILECFQLPKDQQEEAVKDVLSPKQTLTLPTIPNESGFQQLADGSITYKGQRLPKSLQQKVESIVKEKLPLEPFEKFWELLQQNPSNSSVEELIDFLSYRELPITEDGYILAYKGVGRDYFSVKGNTTTTVIKGTVDFGGKIYNGIGEEIEVLRRDVDDNRENECSHGLHVGSYDYASSWGDRTLVVKVNPADVVSVPKDCQFQKCRVSKYVVISEIEREIVNPVCDDNAEPILDNAGKEYSEEVSRIDAYLSKKREEGVDHLPIRSIQCIFSPKWISREKVLAALQELDYFFYQEDGVWYVDI